MRRRKRPVAGLCVFVIALAAFLPGVCALVYIVVEPQWVLLPDDTLVAVVAFVRPGDEQPIPLLSVLPSRAPPARSLA